MKWLVLASLIAANLMELPSPIVKINSGLVRGRVSENGKFYKYFGIPYGTVNDSNRFQAPLPPPKWNGILEADNVNTRCPQKMGLVIMGETDCLKLNIYTPIKTETDKLLPVMVYIHGGCFFEGSGSNFLYGGDFFVEQNVVFVGVNYRLNVEGFLCLGIKQAPGNAGLKDQVAALKWVNENIHAFGGDPNNITLFGESAGAVSSSFLLLSSAAKGLFHKVILQSGSTLAPWALQHDPINTASTLVKEFGYNTKDPYEIYSIISKKSVTELISAIKYSSNKNYITAETLFTPCVENQIPGIEPIITKYPGDVIASGNYTKVPMIVGFNDLEGIYFVAKDYGNTINEIDVIKPLQSDLVFPTEYDLNSTSDRVKKYYFSTNESDMTRSMVNLYSDLHFKFPAIVETQLYARTTDEPIYYYLFKYSGFINMPKFISLFSFMQGASHADELFYMFKPYAFPLPWRHLETKMIERMVTLWTNFAKYSDPTPKTTHLIPLRWEAGHKSGPKALVIDSELSTAPVWDEASVRLWNETYSRYRRKNYGFKNQTRIRSINHDDHTLERVSKLNSHFRDMSMRCKLDTGLPTA